MDIDEREQIAASIELARGRIAAACRRVGRLPDEVTLIAVTKTVGANSVRVACERGLTDFGENRVQEALPKAAALRDLPLRWHMIGHLQSNKAGPTADLFHMVHSVDSVGVAEHLSRRAARRSQRLPVLLEVNCSGEESKFGFAMPVPFAASLSETGGQAAPAAFLSAVERILALPELDMQGLMTIAPIVAEAEQARPYFRALRELRDSLRAAFPGTAWRHLSMGMTDDFEIAIEEGATLVRLGRAIFRARQP